MYKYVRYDKEKTYIDPVGGLDTPERVATEKCPAAALGGYLVLTDESETIAFGYHNLNILRSLHNIDSSLSEEEAIKAAEDIENSVFNQEPPTESPEMIAAQAAAANADAMQRIAAQMEFNNMMQYGVVTPSVVEANLINGLWTDAMAEKAIDVGALEKTEVKNIKSSVQAALVAE